MLRTILATLGLGFAGAALAGGTALGAGPIAAGLAGGIAGNLATDVFNQLDRQMWDRFTTGWRGIDDQHHIVSALRRAELAAVRVIVERYVELMGAEDDRLGSQMADEVSVKLYRYIGREEKKAKSRSFDSPPELERLAVLPATFDAALASRRSPEGAGASAAALAWRRIAEQVVLLELRAVVGAPDQPLPGLLESVFMGEDEPGWFNLFIRDAADSVAGGDPAFVAAWNAEQTALIRCLVDSSHMSVVATDANIKLLAARFDSGLLILESIGSTIGAMREDLGKVLDLLDPEGTGAPALLPARQRSWSLPQPPADFVGRSEQRETLGADLRAGGRGLISAVRGMGGIGKTSLAAIVGRDVASDFPDGCFWLDLKGSRPGLTLSAHDALGKLIHQIDMLASLADDNSARIAQFRSLAVGRRMLIILDDARDAAQCDELLPPAFNGLLITSRRSFHLPGLKPIELPLLSEPEATALLFEITGASGRALLPTELAAIVSQSGRLPLALRAAGAFLAENVDWTAGDYVRRLTAVRGRLDALRTEDPDLDVRAVLQFSYTQLDEEQPILARQWIALAVIPGTFDAEAAAAIWSCSEDAARDRLSALVRRAMLEFDIALRRYRFHDLMRDLAEELVSTGDHQRDGV